MNEYRPSMSARFFPRGRAAAAVMAVYGIGFLGAALIAFRFSKDEIDWSTENPWLLTGTLLVTTALFFDASWRWSPRRAGELLLCSVTVPLLAEWSGINFGFPFGTRYSYHENLTPKILGQVPFFILFAWFSLLYHALALLESIPTRLKGRDRVWLKALLAALLVTACDLMLDPLAVDIGAWVWERRGPWWGAPLPNFAGWLLVSVVVYGLFHSRLFPVRHKPSANAPFPQKNVWMGWALMTAVFSYCLVHRIESGWKILPPAYLVILATLAIWHRWGKSSEAEHRDF